MPADQLTIRPLIQFKGLYQKHRYKVLASGRSSGKSYAIAQSLLYYACTYAVKVLCLRQYQNSISDSSYQQLQEVAEAMGVYDDFDWLKTEIRHKTTGSTFIFRGLDRNARSLKSIPGIDIAWVEEAETITQESLDILIPTIRKEGSELWFSFNPRSPADPVYQKFFVSTPADCWVCRTNYFENPYNSTVLLAEAEESKRNNPELYRHIWLGELLSLDSLRMVKRYEIDNGIAVMDNWKTVVGIDLARDGGDKTVVCIRKGKKILKLQSYDTMDLDSLSSIILDIDRVYKPFAINVDSTGHGAWAPDAVRAATDVRVRAVNFSEKSDDPRYSNVRTQLYGLTNDFFVGGGVIPNDGALMEELAAATFHYARDNRMQMDLKEEIKARIGRSPDKSDALALSMLCDGDLFEVPAQAIETAAHLRAMRELMSGGGFT